MATGALEPGRAELASGGTAPLHGGEAEVATDPVERDPAGGPIGRTSTAGPGRPVVRPEFQTRTGPAASPNPGPDPDLASGSGDGSEVREPEVREPFATGSVADPGEMRTDEQSIDFSPTRALRSIREVARAALPAVVSLDVLRDVDGGGDVSAAAGFVFGPDGIVVTAAHVVEDALVVVAQFTDGSRHPMAVVGQDPRTDLAVLRFDRAPHRLPSLTPNLEPDLFPGDWVVTIGGPLGLDHSVSTGIVSHTERRLRTADGRGTEVFLQLTGLVHPGSSGGPVLDLHGDLVGMTMRKMNGTSGISFALPISTVASVVQRIVADEDQSPRYELGATLYEHRRGSSPRPLPKGAVPEGGVAVAVVDVESGRAADRAGLRSGDLLVSLNREPIRSLRELEDELTYGESGAQVEFGVVRSESGESTIAVELLPAVAPAGASPRP